MIDPQIQAVVAQIHAAPPLLVLEFAGAGSLGLFWLHAVAGSSRTILEATDRYASHSLADLLGATPAQAVAPETAQAMATRAYERALLLNANAAPALGVSCTATIATDRLKRGEHRCYIAVRAADGVTTYGLTLVKGLRDRLEEEALVSRLLIHAIARANDVAATVSLDLDPQEQVTQTLTTVPDPIAHLLNGAARTVTIAPDDGRLADQPFVGALLSGSFNPLHAGHERLLQTAAALLGLPAAFELPIINADKAPLSYAEVLRRIDQFRGRYTVILDLAPLFVQKAALFPSSVFVVGYDTAERLVAPRYYDNSEAHMIEAMATIRAAGCRFLVAGRVQDGVLRTLPDLAMPDAVRDLFTALPSEAFRMDISSTELRAKQ